MKKFDIHRWWIPGKSMYAVFVPLGVWTFIYLVISACRMSSRLLMALKQLAWEHAYGHIGFQDRIIDPSVKMAPYSEVIKGTFAGYWWVLLLCAVFILDRYLWLKRDRSLYIMKRLPASETFRRCALLLLIYAAGVLVISFAWAALYKLRYVELVPAEVLPPKESILSVLKALVPGAFNYRGAFYFY